MSKIDELKSRLVDLLATPDIFTDGSSLVPKPDYKSIEKQLRPVERGKSRGEQGLPSESTKDPDEVERDIRAAYQELLTNSSRKISEQVQSYNARILGCDLTSFIEDLKATCRSAIADFKAQVAQDSLELTRLNQRVADKRNDLERKSVN